MKVDILGTDYSIERKAYTEDPSFERNSWVGYCDENTKSIVICDMMTHPSWLDDLTKDSAEISMRQTLRHEIVHAFLNESGLSCSSMRYSNGWAKNEEMVDWMALQGPKIYVAWQEVGAL